MDEKVQMMGMWACGQQVQVRVQVGGQQGKRLIVLADATSPLAVCSLRRTNQSEDSVQTVVPCQVFPPASQQLEEEEPEKEENISLKSPGGEEEEVAPRNSTLQQHPYRSQHH